MKLLLITQDYPPPFVGGSVVYVHNLLEGVADSIDLLTGLLPEGTTEVVNSRHRVMRSPHLTSSDYPSRLRLAWMYVYLPWWLLTGRIRSKYGAVILSTGLVGNGLLTLVLRALRVPAIPVAYAEELTIPLHSAGAKNAIKRWLLREAYPRAAGVVAVCGFTRDVLVSIGVQPDRVEIILPMIAEGKVPRHVPQRAVHGRRILTVGRLVRRKGFDLVIEAVHHLRKEIPDIQLTIVGEGPEHSKLAALVAERDLSSHVILKGRASDDALRSAYQQADVFVLACVVLENGDCEGTPTVFIEASALGIPVIAGTGGGTDGAVEHGRNGFLVDCRNTRQLADTIGRVLLDAELGNRLGQGGLEKVAADHLPRVAGRRLDAFVSRIVRNNSTGSNCVSRG